MINTLRAYTQKGYENLQAGHETFLTEKFTKGKKLFILILCVILFVYPVSASNMYNYVYNGTSWVPALATADGQQKYWINMANASYGEVQYNLTVGQNVKVTGNLNVTGISYLSNTRISAENVSFKSGGEFFANSTSVYYNNGSLVTDLREVSNSIWNIVGNLITPVNSSKDFAINNSKLYVNVTSGNVGIGTTSPSSKLTLQDGTFRIGDTAGGSVASFSYSAGKLQIGLDSAGTDGIYFREYIPNIGYADHMVIKNTGNVGIGTTSPTYKLQVAGNVNLNNTLFVNSTSGNVGIGTTKPTFSIGRIGLHISGIAGNTTAVIRLTEFGSALGNFEIRSTLSGSGNMLQFGEGSDTFLTIRSDDDGGLTTTRGNVGIGTTNPTSRFHIEQADGTANLPIQLINNTNAGAVDNLIILELKYGGVASPATGAEFLRFSDKDSDLGNIASLEGTGIQFESSGDIALMPTGNVGIGTTNPTYKLQVQGNANISNGLNVSGGMNVLDGNVGIGTTEPGAKLDVRGFSHLGTTVATGQTSTAFHRIRGTALESGGSYFGIYGGLLLDADQAYTAGSRRFLITNGLDASKFAIIRGAAADTDPVIGAGAALTSGTADFVINNDGNVGIGTAAPGQKLEVIGNINATGTIYADGQTDLTPDYVFDEYYTKENKNNYSLMTIQEVMDFTKNQKHLPGIPGVDEIGQIDLVSFQYKILEKVEELYIYVFEHEDRLEKLEKENEDLRKENEKMKEILCRRLGEMC